MIQRKVEMVKLNDIKGLIFDYGGTIDTNSRHWAEVIWEHYVKYNVPVSKEQFREAYVYGERKLAREPLICPEHNFADVLFIKVKIQITYLTEAGFLQKNEVEEKNYISSIASGCYQYVLNVLKRTRPVLDKLSHSYKMVLVSNFYGNIQTILKDFSLDTFFSSVIESSVVGVRKPDPAIYQMGVDALNLPASQVLVIGDSFSKDVVPAKKVGCKVVWLKGEGWGNEEIDESLPDLKITDLPDLLSYV